MKPRPHQLTLAQRGFEVLSEYGIVYLAAEERTGKTLAAILIAERCADFKRVQVVTKKKALGGWQETLEAFDHIKTYDVTNYHQAKKITVKPDLLILDESHNYISSYPKTSAIWKDLKKLAKGLPIIYISATPHAQGYQQLYHQFALSSYTPWKLFSTFFNWFKLYGIPDTIFIAGQSKNVYTTTDEALVKASCDHLFITATRKSLDFEHEPEDELHFITLDSQTREFYNILINDRILELPGLPELVCDTPMKLRTSLHMLEGGAAKIEDLYVVLDNQEKIDYIKTTWGDKSNVAIFYNYIAEGQKLAKHFEHAKILQATSNAEGIDLSHMEHLVIYSQDFSTARHTQRRARQANMNRATAITVHFLLVDQAVSDQVYKTVSINKTNFVDTVFDRTFI